MNKNNLIKSLKKLGLKKGDKVLVNYEFFRIGKLEKINSNDKYYETILSSILKIVGNSGTIAVNSYSFFIARNKKTSFNHFKTTSDSGGFSEFFRKKNGAIRSKHPIFSVSAIGKLKNKICKNNSVTNYGYDSPYDKMLKNNFKILNFGTRPSWTPFLHVAELTCGLPFFYNKIFKINYKYKRKITKKYFSAFVRFLNLDAEADLNFLDKKLNKLGFINEIKFGKGYIYLFNSNIYFKSLLKILTKYTFKIYSRALVNLNEKKYPMI